MAVRPMWVLRGEHTTFPAIGKGTGAIRATLEPARLVRSSRFRPAPLYTPDTARQAEGP